MGSLLSQGRGNMGRNLDLGKNNTGNLSSLGKAGNIKAHMGKVNTGRLEYTGPISIIHISLMHINMMPKTESSNPHGFPMLSQLVARKDVITLAD